MAWRAALAFSIAGAAVLVGGAALRATARRRAWQWPRRSGGIVLLVAVPVGLVAATTLTDRVVAVAGGALVLAAVGLLLDSADVPRWTGPAVLVAVAAAVTASGLRFPLGGVPDVDVAWTVIWLVLVTGAIANSGNADGQLPSLAGASALGILALAAFARQSAAAAFSAALLGALCGFLAYNLRPASLYVGRAGALVAGFLLAAGAIWVRPSVRLPDSLLVDVLLVAVFLLDGLVVVVSRLRRRRPMSVRLRDHLTHRLVAVGLRPSRTIALLVSVQVACSVIAVFVGRGVWSPLPGGIVAAVLLVVLTAAAMRARMRERSARGFSWRVRLAVFGVAAFVALAAVAAAASAYSSRSRILRARDAVNAAIVAARNGEPEQAAALFAEAERDFVAADDRLGSVVNVPSLVVPVLGSNMHAARELARIGVDLSRAGRALTAKINADSMRFVDGRVPLETVAAVTPDLDEAARLLAKSNARLRDVETGYLLDELADGIAELREDLAGAARDALRAVAAARVAPLVLGDGQPRRYLLLVQNPAELRGTGGLIGNWGILTATDGKVRLEKLERLITLKNAGDPRARVLHAPPDYVARYARFEPTESLENVNISPDFPTVASVVADLYAQSAGPPVDGVVAVDPQGLAALLELTGPVRVPGWPAPIDAGNVVDVTLRDAYAAFAETPERADFLGDVARAAIDRATSGDLGSLARLSKVLGKAAHEGHIIVWFAEPEAERVVERVEVSGRVPAPRGDSLLVSTTNAGANKLDYYLQRAIGYAVTVTPSADLREAHAQGTISVELANTVPPTGVPRIAAGPYEGRPDLFVYGQNHSYLSVYTPLVLAGVRVDGRPAGVEGDVELGRNVYSGYLDVFAQQAAKIELDVAGTVALAPGGWYELTLVRQPTLRPDGVTLRVAVPRGFRIVAADGLRIVDGAAQGTIDLTRTRTVRVRIAHDRGSSLWDRLRGGG